MELFLKGRPFFFLTSTFGFGLNQIKCFAAFKMMKAKTSSKATFLPILSPSHI